MPHAIGNTSTITGLQGAGAFTMSHTIGANSGRVLLLATGLSKSTTIGFDSTPTFNGSAMTQLYDKLQSPTQYWRFSFFIFNNPPIGAGTISIDPNSTTYVACCAVDLYNCNTSATVYGGGTSAFDALVASPTTTLNVIAPNGGLVVGMMGNNGTSVPVAVGGATAISIYDNTVYDVRTSIILSTASSPSNNMYWTYAGAKTWAETALYIPGYPRKGGKPVFKNFGVV